MSAEPRDKFYYDPDSPGWHNAVASLLVSGKWSLTVQLGSRDKAGAHLDDEALELFEQIMTRKLQWKIQELGVTSDDLYSEKLHSSKGGQLKGADV